MQRKDGFIVRIKIKDEQGRVVGETDAVTFKGLLSLAHEDRLRWVKTEIVQLPSADNNQTAVVRATVRTNRGCFTGIGDANPSNVNRRIVPHLIRMAETRATARAFRVAVNLGEVAIEELGDDVAVQPASVPAPAPSQVEVRDTPERTRGRDDAPTHAEPSDRRAMSEEQKKLAFRLGYSLGGSREDVRARVLKALRVDRFEHATRADGARAIDELKKIQPAQKGNGRSEAGHHAA
jgi:hypothetical protein